MLHCALYSVVSHPTDVWVRASAGNSPCQAKQNKAGEKKALNPYRAEHVYSLLWSPVTSVLCSQEEPTHNSFITNANTQTIPD